MIESEFIKALASKAPTPGGGGASAYCGSLASALASMVANLTIGKKTYAEYEDYMKEALVRLEAIRFRMYDLIDEDAEAFKPLAAAYRMPKNTPEEESAKHDAIQAALRYATDVPLEIMEACSKVIFECEELAYHGSRLAVSDVGVALLFARAALQGAHLNVVVNANLFDDEEVGSMYRGYAEAILYPAIAKEEELYEYVLKEL